MQLFSIGLYELEIDGTQILDEFGNSIETYTNDDIEEYSRAWTGFHRHYDPRGNKQMRGTGNINGVDPLTIDVRYRDMFPKMGLNGRYIGDGFPLCADLPKYHFLRRGAKYVLLGYNPQPELQEADPDNWLTSSSTVRFEADPSGGLHSALCGAASSGISAACTYPPVVELTKNLGCRGKECYASTLRVVKVNNVMYEYVQRPCVHQAFLENPQKIKKKTTPKKGTQYMCADPRTAVAMPACCDKKSRARINEIYWGERVTASKAEARCAHWKRNLCTSTGPLDLRKCSTTSCYSSHLFYWMSKENPCVIKTKIDENGKMALVHSVPDEDPSQHRIKGQEDEDNKTFFRVQFLENGDKVGDLIKSCNNQGCVFTEDEYCMCDTIVTENRVYSKAPTRQEVLENLMIGSFHPDVLDGRYTKTQIGDVVVHADEAGSFSTRTVFEVKDDFGVVQLRRNVMSVVRIAGTDITFRNPVHFMSLVEPTLRDAQYETDAAIDHYFYHNNTAPFIAHRLVERLGISNPTTNYIREVADAFRRGRYTFQSGNFIRSYGQGSYGDLAATVAAIILEPEARSAVLDADPVHGSLREPLVKVTSLMRNLEFQSTSRFPFLRFGIDLQSAIGQMAYQSPSVFSFFDKNFQPNGMLSHSGLVSPEAQVHSSNYIIRTMNGLSGMVKHGLSQCFGGFGITWNDPLCKKVGAPGEYQKLLYPYPNFTAINSGSSAGIVDELATVLTSGRLSPENREIVKGAISGENDPTRAMVKAEQLIIASSEFHSTGRNRKTGNPRPAKEEDTPTIKPYKAVVVLFLAGGYDSYNLVVPHTCNQVTSAGKTVLQQYEEERGIVRMKKGERNLVINVANQPCEKFAVHDNIPIVQTLFKDGDLSLLLNMGLVNKPTTKETYNAATKTQLFGHNTMQLEAQQVDPYSEAISTGVLGRLQQILKSDTYGFHAQTLAINNFNPAVNGVFGSVSPPWIVSETGPERLTMEPDTFDARGMIEQMNGLNQVSGNMFGEFWSNSLSNALAEVDFLVDALGPIELSHDCGFPGLNMAVKLMETRHDRGSDRDLIYVENPGWDHHINVREQFDKKLTDLNQALTCFTNNLKNKKLWNNVTLLLVSEFGRTFEPNTNLGTDHGWAGNYLMLGGAVKGGKALGEYPRDLTSSGPLNMGHGRFMPTLSWESIWSGVGEWLGIHKQQDLDVLVPNGNRTGTPLFKRDDLFKE